MSRPFLFHILILILGCSQGREKKMFNDYTRLGPVLTSLTLFVDAEEMRTVSMVQ